MASEYDVVCYEDKLGQLVKDVNAKIAQGWQPIGGISVSNTYNPERDQMYQLFAQALVKTR